eukprot:7303593-Prorocentrum_lima.AAC.1
MSLPIGSQRKRSSPSSFVSDLGVHPARTDLAVTSVRLSHLVSWFPAPGCAPPATFPSAGGPYSSWAIGS